MQIEQKEQNIEFDKRMLKIATLVADTSKCVSFKVGAVLVKDTRIISTGYNGTPSGYTNCNQKFNSDFVREEHSKWSEQHEIHAELNAILFAAKNGVSTDCTTMYCTLSPCFNCCKHMVQAGVKRIVYNKAYDRVDNTVTATFLLDNDVKIQQIEIS